MSDSQGGPVYALLCGEQWEKFQLWNLLQTAELTPLLKFAPLLPTKTLKKVIAIAMPTSATIDHLKHFLTAIKVNIVQYRLGHRLQGPEFPLLSILDKLSLDKCPPVATEDHSEPSVASLRTPMEEMLHRFFQDLWDKNNDLCRDILEAPEMGRWSEFLWAAPCDVFVDVVSATLANHFHDEDPAGVLQRIKLFLTSDCAKCFAEHRFIVFKTCGELVDPCGKIDGDHVKQKFVDKCDKIIKEASLRREPVDTTSVEITSPGSTDPTGNSPAAVLNENDEEWALSAYEDYRKMLLDMSLDELRGFIKDHGSRVSGQVGGIKRRTKNDIFNEIVLESKR